MADEVSGHISVEITEKDVGAVTGDRGGIRTGEPRTVQQKQLKFFEQSHKLFTRYLPMLGVAGGIAMLVRGSKLMSTTLSTISEILGTIFDVFLMPFMPIFVKIMEAIVPLISVIQEWAAKISEPLVKFLLTILDWGIEKLPGIIENISNWIEKNVPKITEWLEANGPKIQEKIASVYNFIKENWPQISSGLIALAAAMAAMKITSFLGLGGMAGLIAAITAGIIAAWAIGKPVTEEEREKGIEALKPARLEFLQGIFEQILRFSRGLTKIFGIEEKIAPFWGSETASNMGRQLGGYIPRSGFYYLHRGEEVKTSLQTEIPIQVFNEFNLSLGSVSDVDFLMSELESKVTSRLQDIIRRV